MADLAPTTSSPFTTLGTFTTDKRRQLILIGTAAKRVYCQPLDVMDADGNDVGTRTDACRSDLPDIGSWVERASADDRWPIYRYPQKKYPLPPGITKLRLPRARRSKFYDDVDVREERDAFPIIYKHYSSYLPNPNEHANFCGTDIAVRRHEVLCCDPYFGGFVFRQDVAHLVVYDDHFHTSWCLEPFE